jgi:hypothetical protein
MSVSVEVKTTKTYTLTMDQETKDYLGPGSAGSDPRKRQELISALNPIQPAITRV